MEQKRHQKNKSRVESMWICGLRFGSVFLEVCFLASLKASTIPPKFCSQKKKVSGGIYVNLWVTCRQRVRRRLFFDLIEGFIPTKFRRRASGYRHDRCAWITCTTIIIHFLSTKFLNKGSYFFYQLVRLLITHDAQGSKAQRKFP